jgi:aspartyl-tRNA(Asn)/glutamyl-tRNA(Gln) amidotransferase subunit B
MEEGSLRCDANVSVRRPGAPLGTRCEIKNLNSMRFVGRAVEFEARRQIEVLEAGGVIEQETRLFDAIKGETRPMRTKEEAHDYRYFPDPDLLPLELEDALIARLEAELPELPDAKKKRFVEQYGLSAYDAEVLVAERAAADYFEQAAEGRDAKLVANWVVGDLFGALNRAGRDITQAPVTPERLGQLVGMIEAGAISGRIAKDVFQTMLETGGDPERIVAEQGLAQISDTAALEQIIDELITANPAQVASHQKNPKALGWFVGQVMKATKGQANPQLVNEILFKKLAGSS